MKQKMFLFIFIGSIFVLGFSFAEALVAPEVYLSELSLSKNSLEPGQSIEGSVFLENYEEFVMSDLMFHFQLLGGETDGIPTLTIDKKAGKEPFSLLAGEKTTKSFSYPLSSNLPDGDFKFRLQLTNLKGEEISWIDEVVSIGGGGKFLKIDNYWLVKDNKDLPPAAGVYYEVGEIPEVRFDVFNNSRFTIAAFPQIVTYKRNVGGQILKKASEKNLILKPNQKQTLKIFLSELARPESYLSEIIFYETDTQNPISNPIYFRWIISGEDDAEILFASPNKDFYSTGEKAKVQIQFTGPADSEVKKGEGCVKVSLLDQEGKSVGEKEECLELGANELVLDVPIKEDINNPKVVTQISRGEKTLDQYEFQANQVKITEITQETQRLGFFEKNRKLIASFLIALILIIGTIIYFLKTKKMRGLKILIFLFSFGTGILFSVPAFAATEVTGGCCDTTINFNSPRPQQTYSPGDVINFSGKFRVTSCANGLFFNKVTFYITEDKEIPINDCCGGSVDDCSVDPTCSCDGGCKNCYGASSTTFNNCHYKAKPCWKDRRGNWHSCFVWCDEVKYLNTAAPGYKIYKLGAIFPADVIIGTQPYSVEYNKNFIIPSLKDLGFSGPVRFYVQYSGTHWWAHWHWNITFQKGIITSRPIVDAGPDKEVFEAQPVGLEGSASDPDNDPITSEWSCDCGEVSDSKILQPIYTAPVLSQDKDCVCALTVKDDKGASASDTMEVKVKDTKLYVFLEAEPSSGRAPLEDVDLIASVLPQSTAIGNTANYTFWCNCSYEGTDINEAVLQCGPWAFKIDGADPNSYRAVDICVYDDPAGGNYTPKVIVEKGNASAAEARVIDLVIEPDTPPKATELRMYPDKCGNYCGDCKDPLHPILYWTFSDPDQGDYQTAYQIQIAQNSSFNPILFDTGKKISSSQSYSVVDSILSFGKEYFWRVRVWDRLIPSDWAVYPKSYIPPAYPYPEPDFSWWPPTPHLGEETQFTDMSKAFGGASLVKWEWTFQHAYPGSATEQNPSATFSVMPGNKTVTLMITDSGGLYCDVSKTVVTTSALPEWDEISPW